MTEPEVFDETNPNGKTDVSPTLNARDGGSTGDPIVYEYHGQDSRVREVDVASTLNTNGGDGREGHLVKTSMAVRRLTPLECERLQGFSDGYTRISWRNKAPEDCPDGPRYKALGNSMAVPVMRWIGEGIQIVDDLVENMTEREDAVSIVQKSIFDF